MPQLHIDFQGGFSDDTVEVRVEGGEGQAVSPLPKLSTSLLTGVAGSLEIAIPARSVDVEIAIPARRLRCKVPLHISEKTWLGVSIEGGQLQARVSKQPFGYL
jgi:hypothetical protein